MRKSLWLAVTLLAACPAAALATEGGHEGPGALDYAFRTFNIAVLVGALAYVLRPLLRQFLRDRAEGIKRRLEQAERERDAARSAVVEMEQRVAGLKQEIAAIAAQAQEDGERLKRQIEARTQAEVAQVQAQTTRMLDERIEHARKDLKGFAAKLAVEEAEAQIRQRLSSREKATLFDRSVRRLQDLWHGGGP